MVESLKAIFKKYKVLIIGASVLISLILGIVGGTYYFRYKADNVGQSTVLYIYDQPDFNVVLDSLENSGALKNIKSFRKAALARELAEVFKPGRYVLEEGMNNEYIIRAIAHCWQTPAKVRLRGYMRSKELLARQLGRSFEADSLEFIAALNDTGLMDSLGFEENTYLAMFIPNTYEFYWTSSPQTILKRLKKEYDAFWTDGRLAKAKELKLSPIEVSTLASIIIEETKHQPEMPTIAGVYLNRLKRGMRLQADPTVRYAVLKNEPQVRRIYKRHLKINSPYNTYKHKGLPPGPITIPTIESIDAVLNYQKHNYLYFCAKAELDGTHHFSASYSKHLEYARQYHRKMNEMGIK